MTSQSFSAWRQATTATGAVLLLTMMGLEWSQQHWSPIRWDVAMALSVAMAAVAMLRWLRDAAADTRLRTLIGFVLSFGFAIVIGADTTPGAPIDGIARFVIPVALGWVAVTLIVAPRNSFIIDRKRWEVDAGRDSVVVGAVAFLGVAATAWFGRGSAGVEVPRLALGALLGVLCVSSVYRIGRELISREAGYAAALLLAAAPDLVREGAAGSRHMTSMALMSMATLLLLRTWRTGSVLAVLGAGMCAGVVGVVEPLTASVLGNCVFLWAIVVSGPGLTRVLRAAAWFALGVLLPVGAWVAWQRFGTAGFLVAPQPAASTTTDYWNVLWNNAGDALPLFLVIPLVVIAFARRVRVNGILAVLFLPLPIMTFFQSGDAVQHLVELLPFVFVGLGAILATMWREGMLHRGAFAVLVVGQVTATVLMIVNRES